MAVELDYTLALEVLGTVASLAFIVLLIRERIECWVFGITGSLISVGLFIEAKLYSEAGLYLFYAAMGVWGWQRWYRREQQHANPVRVWPGARHARAVVIASLAALGLGLAAQHLTDAERPVYDAFTTCFSVFATYLEISKVLEAWLYWFAINLASVWLYHDRDLDIYALLIAVYSLLSVWGFFGWLRSYRSQAAA